MENGGHLRKTLLLKSQPKTGRGALNPIAVLISPALMKWENNKIV